MNDIADQFEAQDPQGPQGTSAQTSPPTPADFANQFKAIVEQPSPNLPSQEYWDSLFSGQGYSDSQLSQSLPESLGLFAAGVAKSAADGVAHLGSLAYRLSGAAVGLTNPWSSAKEGWDENSENLRRATGSSDPGALDFLGVLLGQPQKVNVYDPTSQSTKPMTLSDAGDALLRARLGRAAVAADVGGAVLSFATGPGAWVGKGAGKLVEPLSLAIERGVAKSLTSKAARAGIIEPWFAQRLVTQGRALEALSKLPEWKNVATLFDDAMALGGRNVQDLMGLAAGNIAQTYGMSPDDQRLSAAKLAAMTAPFTLPIIKLGEKLASRALTAGIDGDTARVIGETYRRVLDGALDPIAASKVLNAAVGGARRFGADTIAGMFEGTAFMALDPQAIDKFSKWWKGDQEAGADLLAMWLGSMAGVTAVKHGLGHDDHHMFRMVRPDLNRIETKIFAEAMRMTHEQMKAEQKANASATTETKTVGLVEDPNLPSDQAYAKWRQGVEAQGFDALLEKRRSSQEGAAQRGVAVAKGVAAVENLRRAEALWGWAKKYTRAVSRITHQDPDMRPDGSIDYKIDERNQINLSEDGGELVATFDPKILGELGDANRKIDGYEVIAPTMAKVRGTNASKFIDELTLLAMRQQMQGDLDFSRLGLEQVDGRPDLWQHPSGGDVYYQALLNGSRLAKDKLGSASEESNFIVADGFDNPKYGIQPAAAQLLIALQHKQAMAPDPVIDGIIGRAITMSMHSDSLGAQRLREFFAHYSTPSESGTPRSLELTEMLSPQGDQSLAFQLGSLATAHNNAQNAVTEMAMMKNKLVAYGPGDEPLIAPEAPEDFAAKMQGQPTRAERDYMDSQEGKNAAFREAISDAVVERPAPSEPTRTVKSTEPMGGEVKIGVDEAAASYILNNVIRSGPLADDLRAVADRMNDVEKRLGYQPSLEDTFVNVSDKEARRFLRKWAVSGETLRERDGAAFDAIERFAQSMADKFGVARKPFDPAVRMHDMLDEAPPKKTTADGREIRSDWTQEGQGGFVDLKGIAEKVVDAGSGIKKMIGGLHDFAFRDQARSIAERGGEVGQRLGTLARNVLSSTRTLLGRSGKPLANAMRLIRKSGLSKGLSEEVSVQSHGVDVSMPRVIALIEGRIEPKSEAEAKAIEGLRSMMLTLHNRFVDVGGMVTVPDGNGGFQLVRATKRDLPTVPRIYAFDAKKGYSQLMDNPADRRAYFDDLASMNPHLGVDGATIEKWFTEGKTASTEVQGAEKEAALEKSRAIDNVPSKWRDYQILETDPIKMMEAIRMQQAARVAMIEHAGQDGIPAEVREREGLTRPGISSILEDFARNVTTGNTEDTASLVKDARVLMQRLQGREPEKISSGLRAWNELTAVPKSVITMLAGLRDVPSMVTEMVPYIGYTRTLKSIAKFFESPMAADMSAAEFGSRMHELGNLDLDVSHGPLSRIAHFLAEPSNWLERVKTNIFDTGAKTMLDYWSSGKKGAGDVDMLVDMMKFTRDEAENLVMGTASDALKARFRHEFVQVTTSRGRPGERSRMAASPFFKSVVWFMSFGTKRAQQLITEVSSMKRVFDSDASLKQKAAASKRVLDRATLLPIGGIIGTYLSYLVTELIRGKNGHERFVKEIATFPVSSVLTATAGQIASGPMASLVTSEPDKMLQAVAPLSMLYKTYQAIGRGGGPFEIAQRIAEETGFWSRNLTALAGTFYSMFTGEPKYEGVAREAAQWKRLSGKEPLYSNPDKQPEFYRAMREVRQVVDAHDGDVESLWPKVKDHIIESLKLQPEEKVAAKIRSMQILAGLSQKDADSLQSFMGNDKYKLAVAHDNMLLHLADIASKMDGTEPQPWREALQMAGRQAAAGRTNAFHDVMDRALEIGEDRGPGAPMPPEFTELASYMAAHPEVIAEDKSFSEEDRAKFQRMDSDRLRLYLTRILRERSRVRRRRKVIKSWKAIPK